MFFNQALTLSLGIHILCQLQGDRREVIKSKRLLHSEESHNMKASGCKMSQRFVHFDIHKFEFEEYSRKNRMKTIKNEPIF